MAFLYFISPDSIELPIKNAFIAGSSYTNQPSAVIPSMFANPCMTNMCSECFPFSARTVLFGEDIRILKISNILQYSVLC